jgi:hypothetical protein
VLVVQVMYMVVVKVVEVMQERTLVLTLLFPTVVVMVEEMPADLVAVADLVEQQQGIIRLVGLELQDKVEMEEELHQVDLKTLVAVAVVLVKYQDLMV